MRIMFISNENLKSNICNNILRALPSWFGIEESIVDYAKKVRSMPFFALYDKENVVAFIALKIHNEFTAEVYVMGVLESHHRKGLGKMLIKICEEYCVEHNYQFLTVKTLDESRESESYRKTREFYYAMGFKPLEVFKTIWDENNPCLFMVKSVSLRSN